MKAIISAIGKDQVGILALIASECANAKANILDVSQTIIDGMFTMTMMINVDAMNQSLADFSEHMDVLGQERGIKIRVMHQDIFDSMHKI